MRWLGRAAIFCVRYLRLAVVRAHDLTTKATEDVDPAVDRFESMLRPVGRHGAVEQGVWAAPGRELGLGTSAGVQAGKNSDANHVPGTHFQRKAGF